MLLRLVLNLRPERYACFPLLSAGNISVQYHTILEKGFRNSIFQSFSRHTSKNNNSRCGDAHFTQG